MFRKLMFTFAVAGVLFEAGCTTCNSCGHPLFNRNRRCDDCNNSATIPPTGVPVVPPPPGAAVVPPPPVSSGYGPTPDLVVTGQRPAYVNSYSSGCGCK